MKVFFVVFFAVVFLGGFADCALLRVRNCDGAHVYCFREEPLVICLDAEDLLQLIFNVQCFLEAECDHDDFLCNLPSSSGTTETTTTETPEPETSTIAETTTTVGPPDCTDLSTFPGPNCQQYYQCISVWWWYQASLVTCSSGQSYNPELGGCSADPTCNPAT